MSHVKHLLVAGLLLVPTLALAQEKPVMLTLQVEDAMLLVQVLGKAPLCGQTVEQLVVCERARDLLKKIQDQVKLQGQ